MLRLQLARSIHLPFLRRRAFATTYKGLLTNLDDGSESTKGQAGHYIGSFDEGRGFPHGGKGTMKWENGVSYNGDWLDGRFHGVGAKMYSRGGGYEGEWVDGFRNGRGAHLFAGKFGYERWEGPFVSDQPHGTGTMTFMDGAKSEFSFDMGKPLSNPTQEQYEGEVLDLNDKSPSTVNEDGSSVSGRYRGAWDAERKLPHGGFGVMTWENGIEYKGTWQDGRYHGHGRKLYSRGGGYEGQWMEGKREGHGMSFFAEGIHLGKMGVLRWEGSFVNDFAHGVGQSFVKAEHLGEEDERWVGDTAVKGPEIEFVRGEVVGDMSDIGN